MQYSHSHSAKQLVCVQSAGDRNDKPALLYEPVKNLSRQRAFANSANAMHQHTVFVSAPQCPEQYSLIHPAPYKIANLPDCDALKCWLWQCREFFKVSFWVKKRNRRTTQIKRRRGPFSKVNTLVSLLLTVCLNCAASQRECGQGVRI